MALERTFMHPALLAAAWVVVLAIASPPKLSASAPVPGARSTCIGIYHRYPEVPTTAEAALDDMRAMGVQHLMLWVSTKDLYPSYAVDSPEFARFAGLMRERGLKAIAQVGTMMMWPQWATQHPEWLMRNPAGERNKYNYPCWSNPEMAREARRAAGTIVRQAVREADDVISSWSIYDEVLWGWEPDNCHCAACQAGYRRWLRARGYRPEAVGFQRWSDVLLAVSPTTANNPLHQITTSEYREDTLMAFLAAEVEVVKRNDPRRRPVTTSGIYPVVAQSNCAMNGNHARKFQRVFDFTMPDPYPVREAWDNYSLQMVSPVVAVMSDASGRVPTLLVVQDFDVAPPHIALPTPAQTRKLCFQAIGNGATGLVPFIYDCGLTKGADGKFTQEPQPRRIELARIAHWMRDPLVSDLLCHARPLPGVGVVFPHNWYRNYGLGHPLAEELDRGFMIFRDLFQNHYQVTVLFPEDLARPTVLKRHTAIIATGVWDAGPAYGIGRAHERALREFVEAGGALLVGGRTRLLPMAGEVRSQPAQVVWKGEPAALPALSRAAIELRPGDRVLARYDDGPAAAVVRKLGRGRIGIMPSILLKDWVCDAERYVESEGRYVFDPALADTARAAAAVRGAVGHMIAALHVTRPVEARDEQGRIAWYVQPMTLQGEGYRLTFLLNWDRRAHDLVVRMRPPLDSARDGPAAIGRGGPEPVEGPPSGPRWAVVDLFTGERLSVSRRELARGMKAHIGSWQARAFAVAWEKEPAERLLRWQPAAPYAPLPD